ncbi:MULTISPECIES: hypothetical protein [Raoultella]|uniref:hypothetical protein n=1 Tax=Raoultella TaxID=160674 RepID=UPI00216748A6|nr:MULTISPECIES: hypothetical protein [Raoultella]MCS4271421.1 hypothetical protein [Raoultella sp. BIGb0132]MCS4288270.1 hypothetical protein [Raoultella terrigena]
MSVIIFINAFGICQAKKQMMIFARYLRTVKYIAHHQPSSEQQKIVTDEKLAKKVGHRPIFLPLWQTD